MPDLKLTGPEYEALLTSSPPELARAWTDWYQAIKKIQAANTGPLPIIRSDLNLTGMLAPGVGDGINHREPRHGPFNPEAGSHHLGDLTDHEALDRIAAEFDGKPFSDVDMSAVLDSIEGTGRVIRNPGQ